MFLCSVFNTIITSLGKSISQAQLPAARINCVLVPFDLQMLFHRKLLPRTCLGGTCYRAMAYFFLMAWYGVIWWLWRCHLLPAFHLTTPCCSFRSSECREGGLLRWHSHLRDGLCALHPRCCHRHPLSHEDDHAEDAADAACAKALKVPPQETGNRK